MRQNKGRSGKSEKKSHLSDDKSEPKLVRSVEPKRLPASFYKTKAGNEPVREWLKNEISDEERKKVGTDIRKVEFSWPTGRPLCSPLLNGLWEVRTSLRNKIARVVFFVHEGQMILLHGFIKKDQQTPQMDIDIAVTRKRDVEKGK